MGGSITVAQVIWRVGENTVSTRRGRMGFSTFDGRLTLGPLYRMQILCFIHAPAGASHEADKLMSYSQTASIHKASMVEPLTKIPHPSPYPFYPTRPPPRQARRSLPPLKPLPLHQRKHNQSLPIRHRRNRYILVKLKGVAHGRTE